MSARRVLYTHERVVALIRGMQGAHFETLTELKRLQIEVRELRKTHEQIVEAMRKLQAATVARSQAREREILRARDVERDGRPLQ